MIRLLIDVPGEDRVVWDAPDGFVPHNYDTIFGLHVRGTVQVIRRAFLDYEYADEGVRLGGPCILLSCDRIGAEEVPMGLDGGTAEPSRGRR